MTFSVKLISAGIRTLYLKETNNVVSRFNLRLNCRTIWTEHAKFGKSQEDRIWKDELPKPGNGKAFRRIVHYPEKYTVQPLNVTNLAGRDPVTGNFFYKDASLLDYNIIISDNTAHW